MTNACLVISLSWQTWWALASLYLQLVLCSIWWVFKNRRKLLSRTCKAIFALWNNYDVLCSERRNIFIIVCICYFYDLFLKIALVVIATFCTLIPFPSLRASTVFTVIVLYLANFIFLYGKKTEFLSLFPQQVLNCLNWVYLNGLCKIIILFISNLI